MPRWAPLTRYLQEADQDRLDLSLTEIEDILGAPLPASARRHRTIVWSNSRSNPYARIWQAAGYRSSLRGLSPEYVAFVRDGAPPEADGMPRQPPLEQSTAILVGCVKTKAQGRLPARDLYRSPLFMRRRVYAERSGKPWFILSAHHGLVEPDDLVEPYDLYLADQSESYSFEWARRVVEQLQERLDQLEGQVFELHASAAYAHPVMPALREAGAEIVWPFEGLTFGEHLRWYRSHLPASITERGSSELPLEDYRGRAAGAGLARRITVAFSEGDFDLAARSGPPEVGWEGLPEVRAARVLRDAGAPDVTVRLFCTFTAAMERGRDADLLWLRSSQLFASSPWVFDPSRVVKASHTALSDTLRRGGVSRRDFADAAAWRIIAEALLDPSVGEDIHRTVFQGRGDARKILAEVEHLSDAGTPLFPLLRDREVSSVWIRILAYPGAAKIGSLDALELTVDARVRKASEYLDVTRTDHLPIEHARRVVQQLWQEDVEQHGSAGPGDLAGTSAALERALWFLGTWGCTWCERVRDRQPVGPVCGTCRLEEMRTEAADARPGHEEAWPTGSQQGQRTTARQEILAAAKDLTLRGEVPFSPSQLISELRDRGTPYPDSTLRTHIVSTMCSNASSNDSARYHDLVRVARGRYRLNAAAN